MEQITDNVVQALSAYMANEKIRPAEMARRCRLTPGGLKRILDKDRVPRIDTLVNIADVIGVSVDALIRPN